MQEARKDFFLEGFRGLLHIGAFWVPKSWSRKCKPEQNVGQNHSNFLRKPKRELCTTGWSLRLSRVCPFT